MEKSLNQLLSNYHQSLAICYSFVGTRIILTNDQNIENRSPIWILISNCRIQSIGMLNNIIHIFGWKLNYFFFRIITNLTVIIVNICKHNYSYKFFICTSWVIQRYFLHIQQHMILQRILVCNKTECSSNNNFKCLVICIFSNGNEYDSIELYVFSITLVNTFVLIILDLINIVFIHLQYFHFISSIIMLSLYLLFLKDMRFAMVFFKCKYKNVKLLINIFGFVLDTIDVVTR